jgi:signal transduction histidine kinase
VVVDEQRLTQVLTNLLSNAVKYSPEGGTITITGQVRERELVLCVRDQGPGIDPSEAPRIFDRFYRADEASRKTKGAGLGLYLARAVIQAHNGHIWVDDSVRQGARICFSLPREETEPGR